MKTLLKGILGFMVLIILWNQSLEMISSQSDVMVFAGFFLLISLTIVGVIGGSKLIQQYNNNKQKTNK